MKDLHKLAVDVIKTAKVYRNEKLKINKKSPLYNRRLLTISAMRLILQPMIDIIPNISLTDKVIIKSRLEIFINFIIDKVTLDNKYKKNKGIILTTPGNVDNLITDFVLFLLEMMRVKIEFNVDDLYDLDDLD